jgi:cytochrome P450
VTADVREDTIYHQLSKLFDGPRVVKAPPNEGMGNWGGAWRVTRAEDIRYVLQHPDIFSSHNIAGFSRLIGQDWDLIPLEKDPPEHSKYRAVMNGVFAPAKINAMETGVRARAADLIEKFAGQDGCEFVEAFARPFPVSIFMQLMGLPDEDTDKVNDWEYGLLHSGDLEQRKLAARHFYDYLGDLIALRRREPANDLTTFCIQAQIDGRPTTDEEIMGMCYLLVVAGLDTVAASLSLHFRHLALFPEDQQRLREDPSLIPSAVEELLRAYAIVTTNRWVTQDVEVGGQAMKAGDRVICSTPLACLDPAEFENPLTVDIERSPNRHVAFSYGPHRCIGSHLARRELIIAMEEMLKRIPPFRLAEGADAAIKPVGLYSAPHLPLVWG